MIFYVLTSCSENGIEPDSKSKVQDGITLQKSNYDWFESETPYEFNLRTAEDFSMQATIKLTYDDSGIATVSKEVYSAGNIVYPGIEVMAEDFEFDEPENEILLNSLSGDWNYLRF